MEVFEIHGPLFFGAAYKFKDAMKIVENHTQILIIRMRFVPIIDATGLGILKEVNEDMNKRGARLILSDVNSEQVIQELRKSRLLFRIGRANVTKTLDAAIKRGKELLIERDNNQPAKNLAH
ncbi:MAG: sodium-independent anion transporter [Chitinophagaceae bacterium]|nr:sodium-independent anion transporter [Chitinophagaceae bacterium]